MANAVGRRLARGQQANVASRADVLDVVPVANCALRIERQGEGLLLWVPLRPRWWMGPPLGWILPFRREKGLALDALGRQVFEACNGKSTIERIVEGFAARHQLRFHEARQLVLTFLRMLVERKVVALLAAGTQSGDGTEPALNLESGASCVES
jgi:hypothetical protein